MLRSCLILAWRIEARRWQGCLWQDGTWRAAREPLKERQRRRSGRARPPSCANTFGRAAKTRNRPRFRAGYAGGASAEVTASRLLRNLKIAAEIEKAQGRLLRRHERRDLRIASCAKPRTSPFVNLLECFDDKGALLPLSRMPKRARQAISRSNFKDGKPSKLIVRDKLPALKILINYLGIFNASRPTRLRHRPRRRKDCPSKSSVGVPAWNARARCHRPTKDDTGAEALGV